MADVDVLARVIGGGGLGLAVYTFFANRRTARMTVLKLIHAKLQSLRVANNKRSIKLRNIRDSRVAPCMRSKIIDSFIDEAAQVDSLINEQSRAIVHCKKSLIVRIFGFNENDLFLIESSIDRASSTSDIMDSNISDYEEMLRKGIEAAPCMEGDTKTGAS